MRIRVIDLETDGLEPTDKVVEIAAWDLAECVEIYRVGEPRLVNPGRPIPPRMSAIHHITDEDVAGAPPWPEAAYDLFTLFSTSVVAFAAHNAKFERQWCTDALTGGKPWVCTYRCALRIWPEAPGHSNQELRYWLKPHGLDREVAAGAHRAGPDAYVTAFTLRHLLRHAPLSQLIEWSATPALLPRITFGKHKGAAWKDAPRDYLEWICRQTDMSEDVRFTAQQTLKQGAKP